MAEIPAFHTLYQRSKFSNAVICSKYLLKSFYNPGKYLLEMCRFRHAGPGSFTTWSCYFAVISSFSVFKLGWLNFVASIFERFSCLFVDFLVEKTGVFFLASNEIQKQFVNKRPITANAMRFNAIRFVTSIHYFLQIFLFFCINSILFKLPKFRKN